jgi:CHAT domain-containing protein
MLRSKGRLLYNWLVAPFQGRLDLNRALIIEADGDLATLPFQALVEPDGSYLGLHRTIVFAHGLSYMFKVHQTGRISTGIRALVVGEPAGSKTGVPLPGARREADEISHLFANSVVLKGKEASEPAILSYLQQVNVFHFAGHAASGPQGSGLEVAADTESDEIVSGTLLSPERIATASLRSLWMVVLSACSTGRPIQDGLAEPEDIASAFLRAGVPYVIASWWDVDSESTLKLMSLIYHALLAGASPSDAVRRAAQQVCSNPIESHPYYWAAFSVFGRA